MPQTSPRVARDLALASETGSSSAIPTDGRRARTAIRRAALMQSFLRITQRTGRLPSAQALADMAGCSVRTVFERFNTIEGIGVALLDEILVQPCLMPSARQQSFDLPRRIALHVRIRADVAERWFRLWMLTQYYQAPEVAALTDRARVLTRSQTMSFYAPELSRMKARTREAVLLIIESALDLDTWGTMRTIHHLSVHQSRQACKTILRRVLFSSDADHCAKAPRLPA